MMNAQLFSEHAQSCRLLASHQQNEAVLDMLHVLEEDLRKKPGILGTEIDRSTSGWSRRKTAIGFDPRQHAGSHDNFTSGPAFIPNVWRTGGSRRTNR
jgi:hypothetical protein